MNSILSLPSLINLKQCKPIWMQTLGQSNPAEWCDKMHGMHRASNTLQIMLIVSGGCFQHLLWLMGDFKIFWVASHPNFSSPMRCNGWWDGTIPKQSWVGSDAIPVCDQWPCYALEIELLKCPYLVVGDVWLVSRASHPVLCWVASIAWATVPATSNAITAVDPLPLMRFRCLPDPCLRWNGLQHVAAIVDVKDRYICLLFICKNHIYIYMYILYVCIRCTYLGYGLSANIYSD